MNHHHYHDRTAIPDSGSIESEGDVTEPIYVDRGGSHISEIVTMEILAVHRQEAKSPLSPQVFANPHGLTREARDGDSA